MDELNKWHVCFQSPESLIQKFQNLLQSLSTGGAAVAAKQAINCESSHCNHMTIDTKYAPFAAQR